VIDDFRRAHLPLAENCQWPFALPALMRHAPPSLVPPFRQVAIGFAPPRTGRDMARGLLPHLLSVAQALLPLDPATRVDDVHWDEPGTDLSVLRFRLRGPGLDLAVSLHQLAVSKTPPRPFWLEVNGTRFVRRVAPDYTFRFAAGADEFSVPDPMMRLVESFVAQVRQPDPAAVDAGLDVVRRRLQLCHAVLASLSEEPPGSPPPESRV
jgi:hypothetical protein